MDKKNTKVYFGDKKSKSSKIIVACLCGVFSKSSSLRYDSFCWNTSHLLIYAEHMYMLICEQ